MTTVLVVDDEGDIRLLARLVLEGSGMEVLEAASAHEALRILQVEHIGVVVLDLRMPELDGWAVLDSMRKAGMLERLGVIVVSAHADPSTAALARAAGTSGYLKKPFHPHDLVEAVRRADPGDAA